MNNNNNNTTLRCRCCRRETIAAGLLLPWYTTVAYRVDLSGDGPKMEIDRGGSDCGADGGVFDGGSDDSAADSSGGGCPTSVPSS